MRRGLAAYREPGRWQEIQRAGMSRDAIHSIRAAFQCIHSHRTTSGVVAAIRETCPMTLEVTEMLDFIAASKRGIQPSLKFVNYLNQEDGE